MHEEMPFGLTRQTTHAALSSEDLNSLGKQAANMYLTCQTPLNTAVVKLAQEHASISPHQVMRIVEYANQETFQRLFDDNEKYASDKNIEFPLADPRAILHELNDGARPHVMTPPPDDYSQAPVKLAHADVEADLELCRAFGVEPVSPGMEKEAAKFGKGIIQGMSKKYDMHPGFVEVEAEHAGDEKTLEYNIAAWSDYQKRTGGPGVSWDRKKWGGNNPLAGMGKEASLARSIGQEAALGAGTLAGMTGIGFGTSYLKAKHRKNPEEYRARLRKATPKAMARMGAIGAALGTSSALGGALAGKLTKGSLLGQALGSAAGLIAPVVGIQALKAQHRKSKTAAADRILEGVEKEAWKLPAATAAAGGLAGGGAGALARKTGEPSV